MQDIGDMEKSKILDFISEIIDREKSLFENKQIFAISTESQKIKERRLTKKLFDFFEQKNYYIISLEEKNQIPRDRSQLADWLTKNRKILFPFTHALLHSQEESFSAEDAPQETLTCLLNTCKRFADMKLIEYEYDKKEKIIRFKRLADLKGEIRNFLSGIFGEYGAAKLIERTLQQFAKAQNGFKYKIFHNVCLKKADSDKSHDIQLDLVVQLPDGFYIFETKMGAVLAIDKWVDRTRLFASEKNRFITCCADENLNPKIFQPFMLFNFDHLQEQLSELLQKDYSNCIK